MQKVTATCTKPLHIPLNVISIDSACNFHLPDLTI
jgi:hypothetical protein